MEEHEYEITEDDVIVHITLREMTERAHRLTIISQYLTAITQVIEELEKEYKADQQLTEAVDKFVLEGVAERAI